MSGFNGVSRVSMESGYCRTHGEPPTCQHLLNCTGNCSKSIVGRFDSHPKTLGWIDGEKLGNAKSETDLAIYCYRFKRGRIFFTEDGGRETTHLMQGNSKTGKWQWINSKFFQTLKIDIATAFVNVFLKTHIPPTATISFPQ